MTATMLRRPATHHRCRRWLSAVTAVATLITAACLTGCGFPDRRGAAESIGQAIQQMPGVANVDVDYDTSFDGGAHFRLTVTLSPALTTAQGADVGRAFVEQMIAADFAHFHVTVELAYVRPGPDAAGSQLSVNYDPDLADGALHADPSPDAVAEGIRWWLDIAQSPAVAAVGVELPLDPADVLPTLRVELPVNAADATLAGLIRRHPQLNSAAWSIALPAAQPHAQARTYTSRGRFLDRHSRQIWQRVVEQLAADDHAEASTLIPPKRQHDTPTTVEIRWGFDYGRDHDVERVARGVTALLAELPGPVRFTLRTRVSNPATGDIVDRDLTITIGGCTAPNPDDSHRDGMLEDELRQRFERC